MMQTQESNMSERDFIFWLQGFLEMGDVKTLNEKQVQTIKDHIKLVVTKFTPNHFTITHPIGTLPLSPIDTTIVC